MGRCLDKPPINLAKVHVPETVMNLVPKDMAKSYKLVPIAVLGNKLFVAMADPMNVLALDDLRTRTKMDIIPMIATERSGQRGAQRRPQRHRGHRRGDEEGRRRRRRRGRRRCRGSRRASSARTSTSTASPPTARTAPSSSIVNLILVQALKDRASDIHIEPAEKSVRLRYRMDGNLVEASGPPKSLQLAIASRIKILAGLNIAERRVPQDGRFRIRVSGKEVDLRISFLPTVYGEKIVIRILDKGALTGSIDGLGLDETTLATFKKAIDAPHGMILVTGPTGSGKTTTLYSVLSELNKPEYNIVTVEDPVEYQLQGINQVAVKADVGLDFSSALRSILRQDPDIVMIGEIRDNETADIAVKAALTGHQVLSTLHTNDAAGAITRLDDMGIEPFLIASSVLLTCAQRLVRRICPNCKEEFLPEPDMFSKLDMESVEGDVFYRGGGCDRCKQRGYLGRAAIMEVLPVSEAIRRLIIKRASAAVLKSQALSEGMKTLRLAGIDKAHEGVTSLEEVWKLTAADV